MRALRLPCIALAALLSVPRLRGVALYRTALFLPTILSSVSVAFVWRFVYDPNFRSALTGPRAAGELLRRLYAPAGAFAFAGGEGTQVLRSGTIIKCFQGCVRCDGARCAGGFAGALSREDGFMSKNASRLPNKLPFVLMGGHICVDACQGGLASVLPFLVIQSGFSYTEITALVLAIALSTVLPRGLGTIVLAIGLTSWPSTAAS